jgi:hypothetical protein
MESSNNAAIGSMRRRSCTVSARRRRDIFSATVSLAPMSQRARGACVGSNGLLWLPQFRRTVADAQLLFRPSGLPAVLRHLVLHHRPKQGVNETGSSPEQISAYGRAPGRSADFFMWPVTETAANPYAHFRKAKRTQEKTNRSLAVLSILAGTCLALPAARCGPHALGRVGRDDGS